MNQFRWLANMVRRSVGTITRVSTEKPLVALTFDDGPDPVATPHLLDILERNQARATFFMVGQSVQRHSDLIRRMVEAGHALAGHSWDHSAFPLLSSHARRQQLQACARQLGGYNTRLFRPPYGEQNLASRLDALWAGYKVIGWSVTSEDWYESQAAVIAEVLVKRIRTGDIVLLHDTIFDKGKPHRGPVPDRQPWIDREAMLTALDLMFSRIGKQFRFVTVPELMQNGRPHYTYWFKQTGLPKRLGPIETYLQKLG